MMQGYYFANQVDDQARSQGREGSYLRTMFTSSAGTSWRRVKPPNTYRFSQCNVCSSGSSLEECSLHFHGPTSWFAPEGAHPNLYSIESAPNIVMATGNVGSHLDFHPDADCTYLSRDGGETWQDVADNTAIYEIGGTGGTIVMAQHRSEGPTSEIMFSLDQGACFHKVTLPEAMLVENIRVSPEESSNLFLILGTSCSKSSAHPDCSFTGGAFPPGLMYAIDLPSVVDGDWQECSLDEESSDYKIWEINDGKCLMGAKRSLKVRSQESFCADPPSFRPQVEVDSKCKCSYSDLECEFGYERVSESKCQHMKNIDIRETCPVR